MAWRSARWLRSNALPMRRSTSILIIALVSASCQSEGAYPGKCEAVSPGWAKPSDGYSVLALTNRVYLQKDRSLTWNGKSLTREKLLEYAQVSSVMDPRPFTILEIEPGTPCGAVDATRNLIDENAKCREYLPAKLCGEGPEPWAQISDVAPFDTFYPSDEANDADVGTE